MEKTVCNYSRQWCAFALLVLLWMCRGAASAQVVTYPDPPNAVKSTVFSCATATGAITVNKYMDYHYAHFSFSGTLLLTVTASQAITSYTISPKSSGIVGTVQGNQLTFSMIQNPSTEGTPLYLILQINSLEKLVILGDNPEQDVPASSGVGIYNITSVPYSADPTGGGFAQPAIQQAIDDAATAGGGIVYVPRGLYKVKENLAVKTGVTLYLAPGSVLKAIDVRSEYAANATIDPVIIVPEGHRNVTIRGRGEIDASGLTLMNPPSGFTSQSVDHPRRRIIRPDGARNVRLEGFIAKDATGWSVELMRSDTVLAQNLKVLNHKDVTRKIENDGINSVTSSNTRVNQCFVMTIDDALCSKARHGDMRNNEFSNCVVYTSAAGAKAGMQSVGYMRNTLFRNIDVVHSRRGIGIDTREGDKAIMGAVFMDIRIEETSATSGQSSFAVDFESRDAQISDISIINVTSHTNDKMRFTGKYDIMHIDFENFIAKGNLITAASQIPVTIGSDISTRLSFTQGAHTVAHAGADQVVYVEPETENSSVTLDGVLSRSLSGPITTYQWFVGTAQIAEGMRPSVSLARGTHRIVLQVTDSKGGQASDTVQIVVQKKPCVSAFATSDDGNVAENTVNGDILTRWGTGGLNESITFTFCEQKVVDSLSVMWFRGTKRVAQFSVELQVNEGDAFQNVYNGSSSGKTDDFETYPLGGVRAQALRIVNKGNSTNNWISIYEVVFHEKPDDIVSAGEQTHFGYMPGHGGSPLRLCAGSRSLLLSSSHTYHVNVYSLSGKLVRSIDMQGDAHRVSFDVPGVYVINVRDPRNPGSHFVQSVVIKP